MNFTFTLPEIKQVAAKIFTLSNDKKVWAVHGEMGAGKTTLIHALCELSGVEAAFGSPTYSIINEYKSNAGTIYHMDWYRLKDEEEALLAGVEEPMFSGNLCFIEWPERAGALLPDNCFNITVALINEQTRSVFIENE